MIKISYKNRIIIVSFISALAILLFCSSCSFFYSFNTWCDANYFFTIGKSIIFNNKVLYKDIYDHKGLILYILFGLSYFFEKTGFHFIFIIETICATIFLFYSYKTILLFKEKTSFLCIPIMGILVYSSKFFMAGGSAEEFTLPILAYTLYIFCCYKKRKFATIIIPFKKLFILGILTGIIFWIKYTVLGFIIIIIAMLLLEYALSKKLKDIFKSLLSISCGFLLISMPCLLYFIISNSIVDLWNVYFYNNIVSYGHFLILLGRYLKYLVIFIVFLVLCIVVAARQIKKDNKKKKRIRKAIDILKNKSLIIELIISGVFVFASSGWILKRFDYYLLPLMIFLPFIILLVELLIDKIRVIHNKKSIAYIILVILLIPYMFYSSMSTGRLFKNSSAYVQFQFAKTIGKNKKATLLNYGDLDSGFYTASNIFPNCKYPSGSNGADKYLDKVQHRMIKNGDFLYIASKDAELNKKYTSYKKVQFGYAYTDDGNPHGQKWYLYKLKNNN